MIYRFYINTGFAGARHEWTVDFGDELDEMDEAEKEGYLNEALQEGMQNYIDSGWSEEETEAE